MAIAIPAAKEPPAAMAIAIPAAGKLKAAAHPGSKRAADSQPAGREKGPTAENRGTAYSDERSHTHEPSYSDERSHSGEPDQTTAATEGKEGPGPNTMASADRSLTQSQPPETSFKTGELATHPREQLTAVEPKAQGLAMHRDEQQKSAGEIELRENFEHKLEPKRLTVMQNSPVMAAASQQVKPPGSRQETQTLETPATPVVRGKGGLPGTTRFKSASDGTIRASADDSAPATKVAEQRNSSEKPPEARGMAISSLRGDLKMVIAGDSAIKLFVLFREYPKSRRNRMPTRSEARREQRIVPVIAKTQQDTREAVIETARAGIYIFSAESENGEAAKATFTLKIYETGSREKVTELGTRTVSGKAVLAKVLMREGILWDDDSAFTGSLEDSESTTKFNAQTGLYWREYND